MAHTAPIFREDASQLRCRIPGCSCGNVAPFVVITCTACFKPCTVRVECDTGYVVAWCDRCNREVCSFATALRASAH